MSSKKRRLEAAETPKSLSAVSALAARRRIAAAGAATPSSPSVDDNDERPPPSNVNFFSPLQQQNAGQSRTTPNSSKKGPLRPPRTARGLDSPSVTNKSAESAREARGAEPEDPLSSTTRVVQYSSFRLNSSNHRVKAGDLVELCLEEGERFLVLGSFGIRVLSGEATIAGCFLTPSESTHWVHAPHCHAIPVIRTLGRSKLELHPDHNSRGLRQLGKLSPLYRRLWNDEPEDQGKKRKGRETTFKIICTSEDTPKRCIIQDLVSPAAWNRKLATLVSAAQKKPSLVTVVCGPKSAGKSTFSKLLTNRLLTDHSLGNKRGVMILDLDPGQPEYAPAGTLSLVHVTQPNLGTPFTHPRAEDDGQRIVRGHALASVTPASDPELYLECAINLYDECRKSFPGTLLIVNTPGWILGTGLDLISELITRFAPDEVLYMSEEGPSETVEALQAATKSGLTELPSQQSEFTSRTAAHLRAMQTMSYFHLDHAGMNADGTKLGLRWNPSPLSTRPPSLIRYSTPRPGILGVLSYDYQSPAELLAETINGMVLAAVAIEDPKAFRGLLNGASQESTNPWDGFTAAVSTTPEGIPFIPNPADTTLDPQYSRFMGLVLVRGLDTKAKTIQVLTPISAKVIADCNERGHRIVLVHGKLDAPSWAYTEDLHAWTGNEDGNDDSIELLDEDTSEDDSDVEPADVGSVCDVESIPWVERLKGNEKRPVGSRVWRVRRDLGRNMGD